MLTAALIEEKELFLSLMNNTPDLIYFKDLNSTYTRVNNTFKEYFDLPDTDYMIGKTDFDIAPYLAQELRNADSLIISSGVPIQDKVIKLILKNKRIVWLSTTKAPIVDSTGKIKGIIGIARDVTENVNIKKALEAEKEELNVTLRSIGDGVISTNQDDNIIIVNEAVEVISGWSREELRGKSIVELFELLQANYSVYTGKNKVSTIFGMPSGSKSNISETLEVISKDGTKKIILCSSATIISNNNILKGYVYVLKDITEQVNIESQLHLSQKMESIGQLAAGIAHEINTPMQYINDNTAFLKDAFESFKQYVSSIERILDACKDDSCIADLRNNKNQLDIEYLIKEIPEAISQSQIGISRVSNIVMAMKDFSHPGVKEKVYSDINHGIEVTSIISKNEWKYIANLDLDLNPSLPLVYCKPDEINQVILNMIVNAAHAVKEKYGNSSLKEGHIQIQTNFDNDIVTIKITDNGSGIKDENAGRIFDPFFTTKEVGKGTGQGLAIAHNIIVGNHKGIILVNSIPDEGTTFTIKLPVKGTL